MDLFRIGAIALCGVFLAALSRENKSGMRLYIVTAVSLILLTQILSGIGQVKTFLETIYRALPDGKEHFSILLKAVAMAYVTEFTGALCRDAGESSIAEKAELAGKVAIFITAMPILGNVLETITELLGG
ncbi:MAG: hypothetical protein E7223_02535 [Clostridiales bacterium]|nr:hypothetical protein [Clostridiales bacterium]